MVFHVNIAVCACTCSNDVLPSLAEAVLALLLVAVVVYLQARQAEWIQRLGFLWRDQVLMTSRIFRLQRHDKNIVDAIVLYTFSAETPVVMNVDACF